MPYIAVRPAREEDRDAVLAFCTNTWEWGDYIDRTWDEWLHNPAGLMLVATVDEQPAGLIHLRMVTQTDAWLEGMRVDPAYRRRGLAAMLHEAALIEAMHRNATYVRLVTDAENTPAIQLSKHTHMRQVASFAPFTARAITSPQKQESGLERPQLAALADLEEIIDYLDASNIFPQLGGLYYYGFVAHVMSDELLHAKIDAQQVYVLRRWGRLDGLAIAELQESRQGPRLSVGYIDGTTIESISFIAYDLRRRMTAMELEQVYIYAPDLVFVRDALTGIGYEWGGKIFYTFERGLT